MKATRQSRSLLAEDLPNLSGRGSAPPQREYRVLRQHQLTATHALEVESIAERIELRFLSIEFAIAKTA